MKKILFLLFMVFSLLIIKSIEFVEAANGNIKSIYLDPGHGGIDGGGIARNGTYEKDINLKICLYLETYFKNAGFKVFLTRTGDYDLASTNARKRKAEDIQKRIQLIDDSNCLLYISIHANIYSSNKISGAQTFYKAQNEESEKIAKMVQTSLVNTLKNTKREALGIKNKYLIDHVNKPGCLVEIGFLSNEEECDLLVTSAYQDLLSYAIFLGVNDYLNSTV